MSVSGRVSLSARHAARAPKESFFGENRRNHAFVRAIFVLMTSSFCPGVSWFSLISSRFRAFRAVFCMAGAERNAARALRKTDISCTLSCNGGLTTEGSAWIHPGPRDEPRIRVTSSPHRRGRTPGIDGFESGIETRDPTSAG